MHAKMKTNSRDGGRGERRSFRRARFSWCCSLAAFWRLPHLSLRIRAREKSLLKNAILKRVRYSSSTIARELLL